MESSLIVGRIERRQGDRPSERARDLLDAFGTGSREVRETRYVTLWDSWPLLILMISAACFEWILRKKVGLV